jgi:hypothetical protein
VVGRRPVSGQNFGPFPTKEPGPKAKISGLFRELFSSSPFSFFLLLLDDSPKSTEILAFGLKNVGKSIEGTFVGPAGGPCPA